MNAASEEGCAGAEERARVMDLGRKLQAMPGA